MEEEELLNLKLAVVSNCGTTTTRMAKRRRVDRLFINLNLFADQQHHNQDLLQEGRILHLLQTREEMLRRTKPPPVTTNQEEEEEEDDGKGLHLLHLLLITATSLDENNLVSTLDNLGDLYRSCSLTGDSVQRVVAFFADGLAARMLTRQSPFYDAIMKKPTNKDEFAAFTDFYRLSPFYQFAHFTANQAIMEAFDREAAEQQQHEGNYHRALHVIDFDISYGFQWPSLIQSLSDKSTTGNRISLRITGFGRSVEEMQETEARLVSFAKGFKNLGFEFFRGSSKTLSDRSEIINIRRKKQETVAVNLGFHLNTMNSSQKISETLKSIRLLNPSVVTLVEQESSRSFLSRFMESLHHFAAMFDSLDDCLPLESSERLRIEKNHLGKEIKSVLNSDNNSDMRSRGLLCKSYEKMETWKGRMESHGFEGMKVSSKSLIQAKLLLKIRANCNSCPAAVGGESSGGGGGFRVVERDDGRALSLGWQDRCLITASTWQTIQVDGGG